jgi:hypothetical protein
MVEFDNDFIERVLQDCLHKLRSGEATLDTVLSEYPEIEEELRPRLDLALWLSSRRDYLDPSPEFIMASRKRVVNKLERELKRDLPVKSPPFFITWFNLLGLTNFRTRSISFTAILILLATLVIANLAIIAAAEQAVPGDMLYSLKLTHEKFSLAMSPNEASQAHLSLRYTQRRIAEIRQLIWEGRYENVPESIDKLEGQVGQTIRSLDAVANRDSGEAKLLASSLHYILSNQNKDLAVLFAIAPGPAKPGIQEAMRVSEEGLIAAQKVIQGEEAASIVDTTPSPTASIAPTETAQPTQPPLTPTNPPPQISNPTATPSVTPSPSVVPTATAIPPTVTFTPLPTETPRLTPTPLPSSTASVPASPTPLPTMTPSPTTFPTPLPTSTVEITPTVQPSPTPSPTETMTGTNTPVPTSTETPSMTPSPSPTDTPLPTGTNTPTSTITPTPQPTTPLPGVTSTSPIPTQLKPPESTPPQTGTGSANLK